jgi:hypothetical protein
MNNSIRTKKVSWCNYFRVWFEATTLIICAIIIIIVRNINDIIIVTTNKIVIVVIIYNRNIETTTITIKFSIT